MKLIIEAGGTKSNLAFIENGQIVGSFIEPGLQLTQETAEDFEKKVISWSELQQGQVESVFLFAAGKVNAAKERILVEILKKQFNTSKASLHSDLLAACYATAGNNAGIVGILGTGSNSCYYNGSQIEKNISPGGFILGDEGSGAHIGKQLLIDYLRSNLPANTQQQLNDEYSLTNQLIIQNVYGGTVRSAAIFCSSFASFVTSRLDTDYCRKICSQSVEQYLSIIEKNYLQYSNKLYLVGSIAFYLSDIIKEQASKKNIELITIIQHPIKDLSLFLSDR